MKLIKNLLVLLIVLAVFIYGILFAIYNKQSIPLDFLFSDTVQIPLSLWSGGLVVVGIVLGIMVSSISRMRIGRENKRLQKEIKSAKAKIDKLSH